MAKKKVADDGFYSLIAKQTKGKTLDVVGQVPYLINTGSLALNYICSGKYIGGGIPGGRITEVYGPPATSKSLLGFCCLGFCQKMDGIAVLLDCERASNAEFAENAGHVDSTKLIVYEPISIEQVEAKIIAATKAIREHYGKEKPILFVWDSIGVTPTEREWKELDLGENPTAAAVKAAGGNERPGERARASGDLLRKINPFISDNNATLFVINQTRAKIGGYGNPETKAGGGEALKFFASTSLRTSLQKTMETKAGFPLGVNLGFANKKSRGCVPGLKTQGVQLFYKHGINPVGGIMSLLLADERVEVVGRSRYKVADAYSDGKDVTFTTSITTRNDLPLDILYQCPKLIDGKSEEEVKDFLNSFGDALNLAFDKSVVEKGAKAEDADDDETSVVADLEKELGLEE